MKKIFLLSLLMLLFTATAHAELLIDVNGAMRDPMPIAISPMVGSSSGATSYGEQIREVVIADLERSGLFRIN